MINKKSVPLLAAVFLAACSASKPIQKVSDSKSEFDGAVYSGDVFVLDTDDSGAEQYRVFSQGSTGFVPQSAVRANAESRANKFCSEQGKQLKLLQERRSASLQILGNFPRSELIFVCVNTTGATKPSSKDGDKSKYEQLKDLKKALDEGLISNKDYQSQKAKILDK